MDHFVAFCLCRSEEPIFSVDHFTALQAGFKMCVCLSDTTGAGMHVSA